VNRVVLLNVHMLLAAFMFPVALMFLVTGGLYTWDIKGGYSTEVYPIVVAAPIAETALVDVVTAELQRINVALPEGSPKLKKVGTSYMLEWTGSSRDVLFEPTANPLNYELSVKETSWYRTLVQLHKAKGGVLFKVYAAALAVALFIILGSGLWLALQIPRFRPLTLGVFALGSLSFILMVTFS
jgi:hypothetical protein